MSAELNVTEAPMPRMDAGERETGEQDSGGSDQGTGGFEFDENGQRVSHGLGQSKSSRRRRRKRKNKAGGESSSASGEAGSGESAGSGADAGHTGVTPQMPVLPGESLALANGNGGQARQHQDRSQDRSQGNGHSGGGQNGFQNGGGQNGGGQNGGGQIRSMQGSAQSAPGQNGQFGQPGDGTKRWKKKFRERTRGAGPMGGPMQGAPHGQPYSQGHSQNSGSSNGGGSGGFRPQEFRGPDTHQPGNNASGGKRKGGFGQCGGGGKQQRSGGSRSFVGPMDHSYRAANGNVFDGPVAQDSFANGNGGGRSRGGYHGDAQPIDYSQGRAIPIAPDAPTKIYFFIEDLFFTAKIQETARKLGVKIAFIKNEKEQIAALTTGEDEDRPGLIVFDLNNANAKPLTLIPKLKAKLKKHTSIVGFLSHLQGDLKAKAVEAGCDTVMPRAAFSQNLPNLLRRYGLEEVEEQNYNQ